MSRAAEFLNRHVGRLPRAPSGLGLSLPIVRGDTHRRIAEAGSRNVHDVEGPTAGDRTRSHRGRSSTPSGVFADDV